MWLGLLSASRLYLRMFGVRQYLSATPTSFPDHDQARRGNNELTMSADLQWLLLRVSRALVC